jgi:cysteine desulfurase/selenocysteine lyase
MAATATAPSRKPGAELRGDFPVLARSSHGRPLAYLDSGATSQKPRAVIEAVESFYSHSNANIHRGVYELAQEATDLYEGARARIAEFVGWDTETTAFTKNVTEAINLVANSWGRHNVGEGDEIVLTQMEHHSNIVPWQLLAAEKGARLRYLTVDDSGEIDLAELDGFLAEGRVKLVAIAHVSNVLGTINPVAEVIARTRAAGAVTLVDAAQAVPHMAVDLRSLAPDFYAWTGHKALGPTGVGVLHGRRELFDQMPPFLGGGDMITSVDWETSTWNDLPWKFEAGTPPIAEAVGLGAAIDYLDTIGMDAVREHERELTAYALEQLADVPDLTIFGPPGAGHRGGVISFTLDGLHPHDIAEVCDRDAVCIRAGHHCAQPLMRRLGVAATARASFHVYSTPEEVDRLVAALHEARKVFEL